MDDWTEYTLRVRLLKNNRDRKILHWLEGIRKSGGNLSELVRAAIYETHVKPARRRAHLPIVEEQSRRPAGPRMCESCGLIKAEPGEKLCIAHKIMASAP